MASIVHSKNIISILVKFSYKSSCIPHIHPPRPPWVIGASNASKVSMPKMITYFTWDASN